MNSLPMRGSDVRLQNEKLVLNLFYDSDAVSQAEIVAKTGLKPSTVLRIFSNLEQRGEIESVVLERTEADGKEKSNRVGRPSSYYRLCPNAHYVVGVSFLEDALYATVVNFTLHVIYRTTKPWVLPQTGEELSVALTSFINGAIKGSGVDEGRITGVGIGCPGIANAKDGVLNALYSRMGVVNYPLVEALSQTLPYKIFLQTNEILNVQNVHRYGAACAYERIVFLSLDKGLTLVSYNPRPNDALNSCTLLPIGRTYLSIEDGCAARTVDAALSEDALVREVASVTGISGVREIGRALECGNAVVGKLLEARLPALHLSLLNAIALFLPDCVVLSSGSKALSDYLVERLCGDMPAPEGCRPVWLGYESNPYYTSRSATDLVYDWFFHAGLPWTLPAKIPEDRMV